MTEQLNWAEKQCASDQLQQERMFVGRMLGWHPEYERTESTWTLGRTETRS